MAPILLRPLRERSTTATARSARPLLHAKGIIHPHRGLRMLLPPFVGVPRSEFLDRCRLPLDHATLVITASTREPEMQDWRMFTLPQPC